MTGEELYTSGFGFSVKLSIMILEGGGMLKLRLDTGRRRRTSRSVTRITIAINAAAPTTIPAIAPPDNPLPLDAKDDSAADAEPQSAGLDTVPPQVPQASTTATPPTTPLQSATERRTTT